MVGWCLGDIPLIADPQGHRVLAALAQAAYQRDRAVVLRTEARRLRGAAEPLEPVRGSLDVAGDPGIHARMQLIVEKVRTACHAARQARENSHRLRESLLESRLLEATLPPLGYVLPPLDQLPAVFAEAGAMEALFTAHLPYPSVQTTLYVWGYGPPHCLLCRDFCQNSELAVRFALRSGWEQLRSGAWAKELTRPLALREMLTEVEGELRHDPAVAGWGLRMTREA
jgi:hypothetical protein